MPRNEGGPKRQRLENGGRSPPAQPVPPLVVAMADVESETDEISRLDIDADFKASLREMTPRSRREIVNDIVRNQQFARAEQLAAQQNEILLQRREENTSDEGEGGEDDDGFLDDDDDDDDDERVMPPVQAAGRRRGRGPNSQHGVDHFAEIMMHLLQHSVGLRGRGRGRGRGSAAVHPILQHIQQLLAQREMGLEHGDIDNMSYEELLALQDRIGYVSKGLRAKEIADSTQPFIPAGHTSTSAGNDTCVVCQSSLAGDDGDDDDDDEAREVQPCCQLKRCKHAFHRACLEKWLQENKTCPLCKGDVL
jgi:hypothetical protein